MKVLAELVVRANGLRTKVTFNGLELASDDDGEGLRTDEPLNEWLMPAGNVLTIEAWPPEKRAGSGTDLQVVVRPQAEPGEEPRPAWQGFTWKLAADEKLEPFRVSFPVVAPVTVPSKLWPVALPIEEPAGDDLAAIVALAGKVNAAFASADVEQVMAVMAFRTSEIVSVFLDDEARVHADLVGSYASIFKSDGYRVEPFLPNKLTFKRVCGGKLLLVKQDGVDLVQCENEDGPCLAVPVYLAKTADGWVVAR